MWKRALVALFILLLSPIVPPLTTHAVPVRVVRPVPELWIDVAMGRPLVEWFNQVARPEDIARVDLQEVELLDQITAGRKLVVFKSVAEAEKFLPTLAGKLDIVGYNLEHGPMYSEEDQADPVKSLRRMRALTREYGLPLAVGPDRSFALSHGAAMAPYADLFVLQVQRVQTEPETVRAFVEPLVAVLREANRRLAISVQVRMEGRAEAIADLVESLQEHIDGVSILTSPATVDLTQELVAELRSRAPEAPIPSAPTAAPEEEAPPVQMERSIPPIQVQTTPRGRPTSVAQAAPRAGRAESALPVGLLPLAGGLLAAVIGGALAAQRLARRRVRVKD